MAHALFVAARSALKPSQPIQQMHLLHSIFIMNYIMFFEI